MTAQGYAWTGFVLAGVVAASLSYGLHGPGDKYVLSNSPAAQGEVGGS